MEFFPWTRRNLLKRFLLVQTFKLLKKFVNLQNQKFLILDRNIEETGEQIFRSNNGPNDCCYKYCGSPEEGLCSSSCDFIFDSNVNLTTSSKSTALATTKTTIQVHPPDQDESLKASIFHDPSFSQNYFKTEDDLYLVNDNSELPHQPGICQAVPNTTIPLQQQCVISYPVPSVSLLMSSSSASSITLSSSSISKTLNNYLLNNNIHMKNYSENYWTILIFILFKFAAFKVLLQLAGS